MLTRLNLADIRITANGESFAARRAGAGFDDPPVFDEKHRTKSGEVFPVEIRSTRIHLGGEELIVSTDVDITERKRAEAALQAQMNLQELLLRELDHRVRNNLSALLSLIGFIRRKAESLDDFADSILSRTQAIASVHAILSASEWSGGDLKETIRAIIKPPPSVRLSVDGPEILIPLAQAQAVGLIINSTLR